MRKITILFTNSICKTNFIERGTSEFVILVGNKDMGFFKEKYTLSETFKMHYFYPSQSNRIMLMNLNECRSVLSNFKVIKDYVESRQGANGCLKLSIHVNII